ncbi:ABATE domain-containing protein, partial [Streptomyces sp.]|uniref:ABATE domain-containing protein n=1 Tax=Streptomyces sp. TaxID=1931 RepID=UPI0035C6D678
MAACATQLPSLREQVRSLLASRVAGQPALPAALRAINEGHEPRPHRIPPAVGRQDGALSRRTPPHHRD